jgi:hypothetical protein
MVTREFTFPSPEDSPKNPGVDLTKRWRDPEIEDAIGQARGLLLSYTDRKSYIHASETLTPLLENLKDDFPLLVSGQGWLQSLSTNQPLDVPKNGQWQATFHGFFPTVFRTTDDELDAEVFATFIPLDERLRELNIGICMPYESVAELQFINPQDSLLFDPTSPENYADGANDLDYFAALARNYGDELKTALSSLKQIDVDEEDKVSRHAVIRELANAARQNLYPEFSKKFIGQSVNLLTSEYYEFSLSGVAADDDDLNPEYRLQKHWRNQNDFPVLAPNGTFFEIGFLEEYAPFHPPSPDSLSIILHDENEILAIPFNRLAQIELGDPADDFPAEEIIDDSSQSAGLPELQIMNPDGPVDPPEPRPPILNQKIVNSINNAIAQALVRRTQPTKTQALNETATTEILSETVEQLHELALDAAENALDIMESYQKTATEPMIESSLIDHIARTINDEILVTDDWPYEDSALAVRARQIWQLKLDHQFREPPKKFQSFGKIIYSGSIDGRNLLPPPKRIEYNLQPVIPSETPDAEVYGWFVRFGLLQQYVDSDDMPIDEHSLVMVLRDPNSVYLVPVLDITTDPQVYNSSWSGSPVQNEPSQANLFRPELMDDSRDIPTLPKRRL